MDVPEDLSPRRIHLVELPDHWFSYGILMTLRKDLGSFHDGQCLMMFDFNFV